MLTVSSRMPWWAPPSPPVVQGPSSTPSTTSCSAGPVTGFRRTASFQYVEKEWMRPEEYDDLIDDPTDYLLRTYIPRTNGALSGLAKLDATFFGMVQLCGADFWVAGWGDPELQEAVSKLMEAGKRAAAWQEPPSGLEYATDVGRVSVAPRPRHLGAVRLLGRHPEGHPGHCHRSLPLPGEGARGRDRLLPVLLKYITRKAAPFVPPTVFIPLHKGADGFMNDEQFRTFDWATSAQDVPGSDRARFAALHLRRGAGSCAWRSSATCRRDARIWHFDQIDMVKAKEVARRRTPASPVTCRHLSAHFGTPKR